MRRYWFSALLAVLLLIALVGCAFLFGPDKKPDAEGTVDSSGGTVVVEDQESPVYGVAVEVPPDGVEGSATIAITTSFNDVTPPTGFNTPLSVAFEVTVEAGTNPVLARIVVPFDIDLVSPDDELVLVHASDSDWTFHFPDEIDWDLGLATFTVRRFSVFKLFSGKCPLPEDLPSYQVPGFDPFQHGFPVRNFNFSEADPEPEDDCKGGVCAGIRYFTAFYWEEVANIGGKTLKERYGEYEAKHIAKEAHKAVNCGEYEHSTEYSEEEEIYQIIEEMRKTGKPVPVALVREYTENGEGKKASHGVLAYKWDGETLYCLDSNGDECSTQENDITAIVQDAGHGDWWGMGPSGTLYRQIFKAPSLDTYREQLREVFRRWTDLSVEIDLFRVDGPSGPANQFKPGDTVKVALSLQIDGYPIETCVTLNVAHSEQHSFLIYDSHKVEEDLFTPAGTRTAVLVFSFVIPEDAPPGTYDILAAVREKRYQNDYCTPVLYDVTGNGPNSGWQNGMWIPGFEVVAPEADYPDLTVTQMGPSNIVNVAAGEAFTLTATVRNNGPANIGPTQLGWYRSTSSSSRGNYVKQSETLPLRNGSATLVSSPSFVENTSGTYYYYAKADWNNLAQETNEDDNWSDVGWSPGYITVIVSAPEIQNTCPELLEGRVEPESGTETTQFTFRVRYQDPDGDAPMVKRVVVDGQPQTMRLESGSAANGVYVFGSQTYSAGDHRYYFEFDDGKCGSVQHTTEQTFRVVESAITLQIWVEQVDKSTVTVNGYVATTEGTIQRLHWDWGDGTEEDSWFPATHTYSHRGTYTITVTAFASTGKTAAVTSSVKITDVTPVEEDYFPIALGNRWEFVGGIEVNGIIQGLDREAYFSIVEQIDESTFIWEMSTFIRETQGQYVWGPGDEGTNELRHHLQVLDEDNGLHLKYQLRVLDDGIYVLGIYEQTDGQWRYHPLPAPGLFLPKPLYVGRSWKLDWFGDSTLECEAVRNEVISTPVGEFECIVVQNAQPEDLFWWAPSVGLVQFKSSYSSVGGLMTYQVFYLRFYEVH